MNHSEVLSRMADYLEGDLALGKRALFDAHIDRCESCRREFVELRETITLLHALPDPEPPPFLVENVMRRVRDGEAQAGFLDRVRDTLNALATPRVAVPATALVVGLLLATGELDPGSLSIPGLQKSEPAQLRNVERQQIVIRQTPPGAPASSPVFDVAETNVAAVPSRKSGPVPGVRTPIAQVVSEIDPSLLPRFASGPPAVGGAPRLTIKLPRGGMGSPLITQVPYAPQSGPLARNVSGVMQAGASDVAPRRQSGFGGLAGETGSEHHKRAAQAAAGLERLINSPTLYSVEFANLTVAEQEIWLEALVEYAQQIGRGDEAVRRLEATGDRRALALATAFSTELRRVEADQRREVAALAEDR